MTGWKVCAECAEDRDNMDGCAECPTQLVGAALYIGLLAVVLGTAWTQLRDAMRRERKRNGRDKR